MFSGIRHILLGSPLTTAEEIDQRLTKIKALAIFSSDALSSVAYATEEILLVLVAAGSLAMGYSLPIAFSIVALLFIVAISYFQTIHGYPSGGGAYIVAHDNLGVWPGLVAGAALLIDYVLTVAVSVTAGIAATTSAFPALLPFRVELCLVAIAVITWMNLRGVRESGTIFTIPTYSFILITLLLIVIGVVRLMLGNLEVNPVAPEVQLSQTFQSISLVIILRAFASGCTALTGVEAISNGILAFKKPEAENAGKTLIAMAFLLAFMFLGITFLARSMGIVPNESETVVSQIGRMVFGTGVPYLALQVATTLILILAANTSFAGFPRLSAILAQDRYLPRQMSNLGDRLVFANGIGTLACLAAVLVVVFNGKTHRLIPLYAIGVFLSFTLSQTGMVLHWKKSGVKNWHLRAVINGIGAVATGVVLIVIAVSKFLHGAWVVLLLIPIFVWFLYTINRHYLGVAEQLSLNGLKPKKWVGMASRDHFKVVVPISGVHRGTLAALRFARGLSKDVTAVVINVEQGATDRVKEKWEDWGQDVKLEVLESPYRSTVGPLLTFLEKVDQLAPDDEMAVVVLPEFVPARAWHDLLHNQTARLIKRSLLFHRRGEESKDRVIIDVPYHLHH